jgi:hypothetical protein
MIAAHSSVPRRVGSSSGCGISAAMMPRGVTELVENGECLRVRRTRVDRLGEMRLDLGEQLPQPPGRETTSGAAQALQLLGVRMQR